ncbi:MAG: putative photosynthetic complex assembly protein PuhE, partial [Pseudomonadota bacterium]
MSVASAMTSLPTVAIAAATALFLWWFSTGVLFWLARRLSNPRAVIAGAGLVLAGSLWLIAACAGQATETAAYLSFLGGIGAWSFAEITFLTGTLTGPVRDRCPAGLAGARRFMRALGTLLWHELAILAIALAVVAITWGAVNQVGTWAFMLLMTMRISAKLNLFLGVPYPPSTLLPSSIAHLDSYFRRGPFTALLPAVVTAATSLATMIAWHAAAPGLDVFTAASYALLWTLLVLGIVEHWFLILPVREGALWAWFSGMPARPATPSAPRASGALSGRVKGSPIPSDRGKPSYVTVASGEERAFARPQTTTRNDHEVKAA